MELIHPISPVPLGLWGINLRKVMKQTQWRKIRANIIAERGMKCETCDKALEQSRDVKAHEDWEYDTSKDPAVARLTKIILSCWHCHAIEHFGATKNMVAKGQLTQRAIDDTVAHFCKINKATVEEFENHHNEVFARWSEMNELNWVVDWGLYSEEVGTNPVG